MTNQESDELYEELISALQEALDIQKQYSKALDKLENENNFLSDTIIQNKLGLITTERRKLINENRSLKKEVALLMGKIRQLRS